MKINGSMSSRSTIFAIIDPTHLFNMDETEFSTSVALLAALSGYTIWSTPVYSSTLFLILLEIELTF
jgi:hypothetical protein